jgi:hypothetical protein
MPVNPKLIEAIILACLEKNPVDFRSVNEHEAKRVTAAIKRGATSKGAALRYTVTRKHFLCGCLDYTEHLPEEHLIVGYGYRCGNTTDIDHLHHVVGQQRQVVVPAYVSEEIRRHHFHRSDAEVIVFHNHPRTGGEPDWLYTLKALLQDLPIASNDDRRELQRHAFNEVGLLRQLLSQGRVLFFLGESGFVKEFQLPSFLPFLAQLNQQGPKS